MDCIRITYGICMAAGMLGLAEIAHADTVLLKDSRFVEGTIVAEMADSVTVETANGRVTFRRDRIARIERVSAVNNRLRDVAALLERGELDSALALYQSTNLKSHLPSGSLDATLLQSLADCAGAVTCTSQTLTALAGEIDWDECKNPDLPLLLSALSAANVDADNALSYLKSSGDKADQPFLWPASTITLLVNRLVDFGLARNRGDIVAAASYLASRVPGEPTNNSRDWLAAWTQIDGAYRQGDLLQASALFRPEMFLHRADLFGPLARRVLMAIIRRPAGTARLSALESANVTIIPYVDPYEREIAVRALIRGLGDQNRLPDAQRVADKISESDPDLGAIAEHLVTFLNRRRQLAPNEPLETYKLGAWARSMNLPEEAREQFLLLKDDPRFTENVALQLQLTSSQIAEKSVSRLRELFDSSDYDQLQRETNEFLASSPPAPFAQRARDLVQLAKFQTWNGSRAASNQAEAEFQEAERMATRRDYDQALLHLNRIQAGVTNKGLATKVRELRSKIILAKRRDLALQRNAETSAPPPMGGASAP